MSHKQQLTTLVQSRFWNVPELIIMVFQLLASNVDLESLALVSTFFWNVAQSLSWSQATFTDILPRILQHNLKQMQSKNPVSQWFLVPREVC